MFTDMAELRGQVFRQSDICGGRSGGTTCGGALHTDVSSLLVIPGETGKRYPAQSSRGCA